MVKAKDVFGGLYKGAKLQVEQVGEVRKRLARGESQSRIAQSYGVSQSAVSLLKAGKTWKGR